MGLGGVPGEVDRIANLLSHSRKVMRESGPRYLKELG